MPGVDTEAILRFIRTRGPVLPVQIAKEINQNLMMAGAILSEMVSSGKLRVSKLKVGGSPLYYPPGQENRLMGFTQHLGNKERATYDLLRNTGVIRDQDHDALTRVTARAIKDFAIPLTVTIDGTQEIFWKWYLLSDTEAEQKIKAMLGYTEEPHNQQQPISQTNQTISQTTISSSTTQNTPSGPISAIGSQTASTSANPLTSSNMQAAAAPTAQTAPPFSGSEYDDEEKTVTPLALPQHIEQPPSPLLTTPPVSAIIVPKPKRTRTPKPKQQQHLTTLATTASSPSTESMIEKQEPPAPIEPPAYLEDPFFQKISAFFVSHSITVLQTECIKNGSEYEFTINMPTGLGNITMRCKALSKSKISDSDITSVHLSSTLHHLPGVLLASGELSKKAQSLLASELKGICYTKI